MPTPLTWSSIITTPLSNNNKIDSLLGGANWLSSKITYSYPNIGSLWSTSPTTGYGPTTGNREPWSNFFDVTSQSDRKFILQMLQKWTNVANLTFIEVSDTSTIVGDIRFAYSYSEDHKDAQAWTYHPGPGSFSGDMWFNALGSSAKKEFKTGTYEGFALLHELGHALGLKHPFAASPSVDSILPDSLDSQTLTVMSYSPSTDNEAKSATYYPTTLMLLDIQAIQYLYGTNYNYNAGNNIYLYSDAINYRETIWDGGGIDSMNYGGTRDAIIDLREGYGSQIGNPIYSLSETGSKISTLNNVWIAYGVTIENAFGGSGDDQITGNSADNSLNGGNGNDTLNGGAGIDTAVYASKRSNYTLTNSASTYNVIDKTGVDGADTLINIERLKFSDRTVALDIDGNAGQAYRIYKAAFNRTPDNGGLKYWIGMMDGGTNLPSVASGFIASNEFKALYGANPSNDQFVNKLYSNVLGRAPDAGGFNYWVGLLNNKQIDMTSTLVNFFESPENQAGVIGVIQNGIDLLN